MLKTISLPNKPLCIKKHLNQIYIGDAGGKILALSPQLDTFSSVYESKSLISDLTILNEKIYLGNWNGVVECLDNFQVVFSKKIGENPIKCMHAFKNKIFVSVDKNLIVLNENLDILEKFKLKYKIYCMAEQKDKLVFGMLGGLVSYYTDTYYPGESIGHQETIRSIMGNLNGSVDGILRENNEIIYSGCGQISNIINRDLFVCGQSVIKNMEVLYTHEDDVTSLEIINDTIVSIGLDYCYKIFTE